MSSITACSPASLEFPIEAHNDGKITVSYHPPLDKTADLTTRINSINIPGPIDAVTWFLGKKGLRKDWLTYFSEELLAPLRKTEKLAKFHLYNIHPWEYLYTGKMPKESSTLQAVEDLSLCDLSVLSSWDFITYLAPDKADDTVTPSFPPLSKEHIPYLNTVIWNREFIWEMSKEKARIESGSKKAPKTRPIELALGRECEACTTIQDKDVSLAYSGLQYVEGIFLVDRMLRTGDLTSPHRSLVFLLANNEFQYYYDKEQSFCKDVSFIVGNSDICECIESIGIHFIPFLWGTEVLHRPYLSDKGKLPKSDTGRAEWINKLRPS